MSGSDDREVRVECLSCSLRYEAPWEDASGNGLNCRCPDCGHPAATVVHPSSRGGP